MLNQQPRGEERRGKSFSCKACVEDISLVQSATRLTAVTSSEAEWESPSNGHSHSNEIRFASDLIDCTCVYSPSLAQCIGWSHGEDENSKRPKTLWCEAC